MGKVSADRPPDLCAQPGTVDVDDVAVAMFEECVEAEQSARRIRSDRDAAAVRERSPPDWSAGP